MRLEIMLSERATLNNSSAASGPSTLFTIALQLPASLTTWQLALGALSFNFCSFSHESRLFLRVFTQAKKIVRILVLKRRVFRLEMEFQLTWDRSGRTAFHHTPSTPESVSFIPGERKSE